MTGGYIMKEKNIRELAKRMGLITVENMCQYTIAQLVYMVANKVNELIDEVGHFESDVVETVKTQNENIQYLLGEGLHLEVENIFDGWIQDGTFDTLINQTALKKVIDRIDETNAQLTQKASKQELEVERARIDTFIRLEDGSTTGDAELIDLRISTHGLSNPTSGNSVRSQINLVKSEFENRENQLAYFDVPFEVGTINTGDLNAGHHQRIRTVNFMSFNEDITIYVDSGYRVGISLKYSDGTLKDSGWVTSSYDIPCGVSFRLVIAKASDTNTPIQNFDYIDLIRHVRYTIKPVTFEYTFKASWVVKGLTNGELAYNETRVSSNKIFKANETLTIAIADGYKLGVATFENGVFVGDSGWLTSKYITIPKGKTFKLVIGRVDDGKVSNYSIQTFVNAVTYGHAVEMRKINDEMRKINDEILSSKNYQISKPIQQNAILSSNNKRIALFEFTNLLNRPNFQSFFYHPTKRKVYKLEGDTNFVEYGMDGAMIEILTKPPTGHDNDCCFDGTNLYISGGTVDNNPISLYRWDLTSSTATLLNIASKVTSNSNGSTLVLAAVCEEYHQSENLYLVFTDYYRGTEHRTDDKLTIYRYHKTNETITKCAELEWDCVYVQGACCVNNYLYVACNQQTDTPSNYKGIEIKIIDMNSGQLVDKIMINGQFEPEGMDVTVENGVSYIWFGIGKYQVISKILKFVAPY